MNNRRSSYKMAIMGLFIAIIILQTFIPWLGYLPLGPASVTILPATIIIGSILLGPGSGALLGGLWGGLAMVRSLVQPNVLTPVFSNPLVALPGRILVGLVTGYLAQRLPKRPWSPYLYGAIGSLINTLVTMTLAYFFARDAILTAMGISANSLLGFILAIVVSNGSIEAVVSSILVGLIAPRLQAVFSK